LKEIRIFLKAIIKRLESYDEAIEIDPYYADSWYNKGNSLEELGRYDDAIRCYDKAIDLDPTNANAWYSKGSLIYKKASKQKYLISAITASILLILITIFLDVGLHTSLFSSHSQRLYQPVVQNLGIIAIAIPSIILFFFFWYREGNIYYRRLSDRKRRRILLGTIILLGMVWYIAAFSFISTLYLAKAN
jgi:tetratricopeptide (TPR) repeat protein